MKAIYAFANRVDMHDSSDRGDVVDEVSDMKRVDVDPINNGMSPGNTLTSATDSYIPTVNLLLANIFTGALQFILLKVVWRPSLKTAHASKSLVGFNRAGGT